MLVLSDIAGSGLRVGNAGYLTGYPLLEQKSYVLAKTWAAPEMGRPGCVWTHSLLIDFEDLAALPDLGFLLTLFRRPDLPSSGGYDELLVVEPPLVKDSFFESQSFLKRALAGLYGFPSDRIVLERPEYGDVDDAVLAVWSQQWPRLRRAFRFCTLASVDRSSDAGIFDLQVLPYGERAVRKGFRSASDFTDAIIESLTWLDLAMADLERPDGDGLRTFARALGGEISGGREAFRSLCTLHLCLRQAKNDRAAVAHAVRVVKSDPTFAEIVAARRIVAMETIKSPNLLQEELSFVVDNLLLIDGRMMAEYGPRVGLMLWRENPKRLISMLEGSGDERVVADMAFAAMSSEEMVQGVSRAPDVAQKVLAIRPEVVSLPGFWMTPGIRRLDLSRIAVHSELLLPAAAAVLASGNDELVYRIVREFGASVILDALLGSWPRLGSERQNLWVRAIGSSTGSLADFLATRSHVPRTMLGVIARSVDPDAIPNEFGEDPWIIAVRGLGENEIGSDLYLCCYLLARALGWRSRSQAELIRATFDSVHRAVQRSMLQDDAWQLLEPRLPSTLASLWWDRSLRLRDVVNDIFVGRDLSVHEYVRVTNDDRVFEDLIRSLVRRKSGRRYLLYVATETRRQATNKNRVEVVESLLYGD